MRKCTYQGKKYLSITALHQAINPNITLKMLRIKIIMNRKKGLDQTEAVEKALQSAPKHNAKIKCKTCKKEKPTTEYGRHASSKTGFKKECQACKTSFNSEINPQNAWRKVIASKPFGNVKPIYLNELDRIRVG